MSDARKWTGQLLYVAGVLLALLTYVVHVVPIKWGIFLVAACFIVGSVFWPGWDSPQDHRKGTDQ